MLNTRRLATLSFAVGLLLAATQARAVEIDFGIVAPTTGTISYAGGANPLVGSGIEVDNVVGLGTPANNGVLRTCFSCTLSFTTGNFTGTSSPPPTWLFSAGGTITLTGGLDLSTIPDGDTTDPEDVPLGSTLLTGTFIGTPFVSNIAGTTKIVGAGFIDVKHENLVEFYGLAPGQDFMGGLNLSFAAAAQPPNAFTSTSIFSGDIVNTAVAEPGTLLLIGAGLAGFGYLARQRRRR